MFLINILYLLPFKATLYFPKYISWYHVTTHIHRHLQKEHTHVVFPITPQKCTHICSTYTRTIHTHTCDWWEGTELVFNTEPVRERKTK